MTQDSYVKLSKDDRAALKAISRPSDGRGLVQLAGHIGVLVGTGFAVHQTSGTAWMLPAMLGHGIALVFLFTAQHECTHRTAFRSRWINDALARLIGFLMILPADFFRAFHTDHHRYTQVAGRDPELDGEEISSLAGYALHVSGLPHNWTAITRLLRHAAGRTPEPYLAGRFGRRVVTEARLHVLLYAGLTAASIWAQSAVLLWFWLLPAVLGQPFLRLFLLAEHHMRPQVTDMLRNSRTTRTNAVIRFLAWNMPYHIEHHAFPAVPFHALPQAHARIRQRIDPAALSPSYLAFHRRYIAVLAGSTN